jgi:phage baseplate assembly protein W
MARNTRTFSDVDLNFVANPVALYKNAGYGTISYSTESTIVTGTGATFSLNATVNNNLYNASDVFIGKIKSVETDTSLTLYNKAKLTASNVTFQYSQPADLVRRFDDEAIKASVKNLVLTANYERPFHSEIGTQIYNLLFEPVTPMLSLLLQRTITQTIASFEPRVNVSSVKATVSPDNNEVYVSIVFTIINTNRPATVNLILTRTR